MKAVRYILFAGLAGLIMMSAALAQQQASQPAAAPITPYEAKFPIAVQAGEYDLRTMILDFPQGAGVPLHAHGGYVLATVLSGEITLKEQGTERIIRPGESWTEDPGNPHAVVNAGAAPARVVVNMLLPKGAEATTILKP